MLRERVMQIGDADGAIATIEAAIACLEASPLAA
jgi:hypothetical protein